METIPLDTYQLVIDLIQQGSLLNGDSNLVKLNSMVGFKTKYDSLPANKKDNWCWITSKTTPYSKFRNELIGVLCVELSEGIELEKSVVNWNKRVDPANYMKAVAPITKRQIEEAKKFVEEHNYEDSFIRRYANINDIVVDQILHSNIGKGEIKKVSIFDNISTVSSSNSNTIKELEKATEVNVETFFKEILPNSTKVELFLENRLQNNTVSLFTSNNVNSKPIFKWDNNFSWTYGNNLSGVSQIKEAVKTKGGKVDGVLRFSIMWAENDGDNSDLDAHCRTPNGSVIYFSKKLDYTTLGNLDIDIVNPQSQMPKGAVENITFPILSKMTNGTYKFLVNQYSARNSKGFKAEIEFNDEIYSYEYNNAVNGNVNVAEVTLNNGVFSISHLLPVKESITQTKEIIGLNSNEFHTVNLVSLSPNYWNNEVGNKHYFFFLNDAIRKDRIRTFHNEFVNSELALHRKVLDVLGNQCSIDSVESNNQLTGIGFNATIRDHVMVTHWQTSDKEIGSIPILTTKQLINYNYNYENTN